MNSHKHTSKHVVWVWSTLPPIIKVTLVPQSSLALVILNLEMSNVWQIPRFLRSKRLFHKTIICILSWIGPPPPPFSLLSRKTRLWAKVVLLLWAELLSSSLIGYLFVFVFFLSSYFAFVFFLYLSYKAKDVLLLWAEFYPALSSDIFCKSIFISFVFLFLFFSYASSSTLYPCE